MFLGHKREYHVALSEHRGLRPGGLHLRGRERAGPGAGTQTYKLQS